MERQTFNRQPARAVIIDLHPPMDSRTCISIKEALNNVLTILTSLSGPCRVPLFSLFIIRSYTECIYQLQPIHGNFSRIQVALGELASLARDLITQRTKIKAASFLDGIQESMAQFNRHVQSLNQSIVTSASSPTQIEVTILTAENPSLIKQSVGRIANHLDCQYLKKIQVICINDPQKLLEQVIDETNDAAASQSLSELQESPSQESSPSSDMGISILDVVTCDNDLHTLKMILKTWLQDIGTDNEHLHITLPPSSSSAVQSLILKCDLHDRMLHPSLFPSLTKHFLLNTGSSNISGPPSSQAFLPIYNLESVEFVDCNGVCESIIYGMPLIVKPTVCWKLDWEELERNQQYFQALCLTMKSKNQAMVLRTCNSSKMDTFIPKAHFLLLPSSSLSCLVLKCVAVNELLIPVDQGTSNDEQLKQTIIPEVMDVIRESLDKLPSSDCYNPLLMNSNLCQTISHLSSNTQLKPANRRGSFTSGRGRGRGETLNTSSINGTISKRRPKSMVNYDSTTNRVNTAKPKRLRIMTGRFEYGSDHVAN